MHPGDTARFLGEQVNNMWEVSTMGVKRAEKFSQLCTQIYGGVYSTPHELTIVANIYYDGGRRKDMQS